MPEGLYSGNVTSSEIRPLLGHSGNRAGTMAAHRASSRPLMKGQRDPVSTKREKSSSIPADHGSSSVPLTSRGAVPILRRAEQQLYANLSPNASCSSDASSDSVQSRASTGRTVSRYKGLRKKASTRKPEKILSDNTSISSEEDVQIIRKRCHWVTPHADSIYVAFHDEEWGVPVHEDKKLFELLVLSGALSELTWPVILSKRHIFREVFSDFEPAAVAKLNEKKIVTAGSTASTLFSETKLRAVIENARHISKIVSECGSFDSYIWSFLNHKPIVNRFRYPRQVPAKTPKADFISKDLVKRGFRCVGPTVIYLFMQAAGMTNDHLISCYRFEECVATASVRVDIANNQNEDKNGGDNAVLEDI